MAPAAQLRLRSASALARTHGDVLLVQPASLWLLTGLLVGLVVVVVAFLCTFSMARKAHVAGVLVPSQGLIAVVPAQGGLVTALHVREGQAVAEGEALLQLTSERTSAVLGNAEEAISRLIRATRSSFVAEEAQAGLQAKQRLQALQARVDDLAAEASRMAGQIKLQQRRVALAQDLARRFVELQGAEFVSRAGAYEKEAEAIEQQQRLHELENARAANARAGAALHDEMLELNARTQRERLALGRHVTTAERELAESEAKREFVVRAPLEGVVAAVGTARGQLASPGLPLAYLLPKGHRLEAELYVPSRSAGFIKPGLHVRLRYAAFPYAKFGQFRGEVREVASAAVRADELRTMGSQGPAAAGGEPHYRIRVTLEQQSVLAHGAPQALKPGMAVEASLELETRKLYEWMLEPLLSLSGRSL